MALTTDQLKKYWDSANLLRKNLDAAEYKHIVLGLVFLKYVSDSFAERRDELSIAFSDPESRMPSALRRHSMTATITKRSTYSGFQNLRAGMLSSKTPSRQILHPKLIMPSMKLKKKTQS
jgi:type I restriction-modification system DNA methylase subunit